MKHTLKVEMMNTEELAQWLRCRFSNKFGNILTEEEALLTARELQKKMQGMTFQRAILKSSLATYSIIIDEIAKRFYEEHFEEGSDHPSMTIHKSDFVSFINEIQSHFLTTIGSCEASVATEDESSKNMGEPHLEGHQKSQAFAASVASKSCMKGNVPSSYPSPSEKADFLSEEKAPVATHDSTTTCRTQAGAETGRKPCNSAHLGSRSDEAASVSLAEVEKLCSPSDDIPKRVKCIYCGKPIHKDKLAGASKKGFFCDDSFCLIKLAKDLDKTGGDKELKVYSVDPIEGDINKDWVERELSHAPGSEGKQEPESQKEVSKTPTKGAPSGSSFEEDYNNLTIERLKCLSKDKKISIG